MFRVGATVLGLCAGLAVGLFVAAMLVRARISPQISPRWIFGGGLAGAALAWRSAGAGLTLFEAALHYLIGYFSAGRRGTGRPTPRAPGWLRLVWWLGLVSGLVVLVLFSPRRGWH